MDLKWRIISLIYRTNNLNWRKQESKVSKMEGSSAPVRVENGFVLFVGKERKMIVNGSESNSGLRTKPGWAHLWALVQNAFRIIDQQSVQFSFICVIYLFNVSVKELKNILKTPTPPHWALCTFQSSHISADVCKFGIRSDVWTADHQSLDSDWNTGSLLVCYITTARLESPPETISTHSVLRV